MGILQKNDEFGNRMKEYEGFETSRRFLPLLPIYARIDGRGFSKFTRGMNRPFDQRMTDAMIVTTAYLVDQTHARLGYVQSDEISLVWQQEDYASDIFFKGKIQKMVSVLASMAAAKFGSEVAQWDDKRFAARLPHFDARVFQLPNRIEATNAILWRAMDAEKNAVSMAAHHHFSHTALQGKGRAEMLAMMEAAGVRFADYSDAFRRGTFVRRETIERPFTAEELARIPEKKRPPEGTMLKRTVVIPVPVPVSFRQVLNRTEFVFDGEYPVFTPN